MRLDAAHQHLMLSFGAVQHLFSTCSSFFLGSPASAHATSLSLCSPTSRSSAPSRCACWRAPCSRSRRRPPPRQPSRRGWGASMRPRGGGRSAPAACACWQVGGHYSSSLCFPVVRGLPGLPLDPFPYLYCKLALCTRHPAICSRPGALPGWLQLWLPLAAPAHSGSTLHAAHPGRGLLRPRPCAHGAGRQPRSRAHPGPAAGGLPGRDAGLGRCHRAGAAALHGAMGGGGPPGEQVGFPKVGVLPGLVA